MSGSSPRVWGIHYVAPSCYRRSWFIPTRVGNTTARRCSAAPRPVHPHACGEYLNSSRRRCLAFGSSPRVWGILLNLAPIPLPLRFIPTRVGNTGPDGTDASEVPVHPHACGEYCRLILESMCHPGSSPRVWGIRSMTERGLCYGRFIPTRVGNTSLLLFCIRDTTVHPHACGEYSHVEELGEFETGSSPRVWGIQSCPITTFPICRFIPTRVGNTDVRAIRQSLVPVHPHACGEYDASPATIDIRRGSSPRVWGIPARVMQSRFTGRFIPTRVGNTFMPSGPPVMKSVHPHACGEYWSSARNSATPAGSSPRVWGIQWSDYSEFLNVRFIPTRVGNTLHKNTRDNKLLAGHLRITEPYVLQACFRNNNKGEGAF